MPMVTRSRRQGLFDRQVPSLVRLRLLTGAEFAVATGLRCFAAFVPGTAAALALLGMYLLLSLRGPAWAMF